MLYRTLIIITLLLSNLFAQKVFLAVHDFEGKGVSSIEASTLTDRLRTEIINLGQVKVVERAEMEEILQEQGYQQSGCFTSACMVEVGKLIGAEKIISGSIGRIGNTFTVNGRMINVETGEIENSITYDISGEIDELLISGMRNVAQLLFTEAKEDYVELNTTYEYYENGQVKSEGQLIGKIKVGRWIYYHNNGRIDKIGSYRNNKEIGQWTYYYSDGTKKEEGSYIDSIKHDEWTYFYADGKKEKEGSYIEGIKHGKWTYFYSGGRIKAEKTYVKGKPADKWHLYSMPNSIISTITFEFENEEINKLVITKNEKTFPINIEHIEKYNYKNFEIFIGGPSEDILCIKVDKINIFEKLFKSNDVLKRFIKSKHGMLFEYYLEGNIMSKVPTYNGLANGIRKVYDRGGKILTADRFTSGSGLYKAYGQNYFYTCGRCENYDGKAMERVGEWMFYINKKDFEVIDYGKGE